MESSTFFTSLPSPVRGSSDPFAASIKAAVVFSAESKTDGARCFQPGVPDFSAHFRCSPVSTLQVQRVSFPASLKLSPAPSPHVPVACVVSRPAPLCSVLRTLAVPARSCPAGRGISPVPSRGSWSSWCYWKLGPARGIVHYTEKRDVPDGRCWVSRLPRSGGKGEQQLLPSAGCSRTSVPPDPGEQAPLGVGRGSRGCWRREGGRGSAVPCSPRPPACTTRTCTDTACHKPCKLVLAAAEPGLAPQRGRMSRRRAGGSAGRRRSLPVMGRNESDLLPRGAGARRAQPLWEEQTPSAARCSPSCCRCRCQAPASLQRWLPGHGSRTGCFGGNRPSPVSPNRVWSHSSGHVSLNYLLLENSHLL